MHLVRDLLDNQVIDRFNRKMGKVDDVVLVVRRGRPPRVAGVELGLGTALARIHPGLARFAVWLERRLGAGTGRPVRIDIDRLESAGLNVRTDVDADHTAVYAWERWIRRVLIHRIPGSGEGGPEAHRK